MISPQDRAPIHRIEGAGVVFLYDAGVFHESAQVQELTGMGQGTRSDVAIEIGRDRKRG
jgi:hypothetical protein